jgi:hypothetical protein
VELKGFGGNLEIATTAAVAMITVTATTIHGGALPSNALIIPFRRPPNVYPLRPSITVLTDRSG